TIAVIAMMGFGLADSGTTPRHTASAAPSPTVIVVAPVPAPSPSPSPSASPSAPTSPSAPASKVTTSRHASPAPSVQGTLSYADVAAFCQATDGGMAWPPGRGRTSWSCIADHNQRDNFTPTDVCQWRFQDNGSRATVGNLADPSTWRCRT